MSKGSGEIISILGIVVSALFVVFFILYVVPDMIHGFVQFLSTASSEAVSRNLAGLITISAAAPNEISIEYTPSASHFYDVSTENRVVDVKLLTETLGMKGETLIKTGTNSFCNYASQPCYFSNVNYFNIGKIIDCTTGGVPTVGCCPGSCDSSCSVPTGMDDWTETTTNYWNGGVGTGIVADHPSSIGVGSNSYFSGDIYSGLTLNFLLAHPGSFVDLHQYNRMDFWFKDTYTNGQLGVLFYDVNKGSRVIFECDLGQYSTSSGWVHYSVDLSGTECWSTVDRNPQDQLAEMTIKYTDYHDLGLAYIDGLHFCNVCTAVTPNGCLNGDYGYMVNVDGGVKS